MPPSRTQAPISLTSKSLSIHPHLFQDVYPWAGQLRTVDLRKRVPGAQPFLPVSMIPRSAGFVFDQLRQDRYLQHLNRDRFIERLAYHYDQVNYLHPFREGNGRTQRFFFDRLAVAAGWWLDWTQITGALNDAASRAAAEDHDLAALQEMFTVILTPRTSPPLAAFLTGPANGRTGPGTAKSLRDTVTLTLDATRQWTM